MSSNPPDEGRSSAADDQRPELRGEPSNESSQYQSQQEYFPRDDAGWQRSPGGSAIRGRAPGREAWSGTPPSAHWLRS